MSVDRHVRRIGILGTRGIPAAHGGFETFVEGLATDLASRGHEVRVYCQAQGPPARKVREWRGVELVEFALPLGGAVSTVLFDLVSTLDAALHGVGELLPEVREWLREQVLRKRNGTAANGPFVCRRPRFEDAAAAWATREKQRHEGWHARRSQKPTVVKGT